MARTIPSGLELKGLTRCQTNPSKRIKIGLISATIWGNETEGGATRYSITIVRNFKTGDTWKETSSFGLDDLPTVAKVSDLALEAVLELQGEAAE